MQKKSTRNTKGDGSWFERTTNGKKYQCYKKKYDGYGIKTFYGATKTEVREKRDRFEDGLRTGAIELKTKKKDDFTEITFRDCIVELIQKDKQYAKESTRYTDEQTYKYYISKKEICDKAVKDITQEDMVSLMKEYSSEYSAGTINHIYNLYHQTFDMAKRKGIISADPLEYVKKPTEDNVVKKKKEIIFLSDDDMDKLYNECWRKNTSEYSVTGKPGTDFYSIFAYAIVLIMETGMRSGELLALQYQDINMAEKKITIRHTLSEIVENGKTIFELTTPKTKNSVRTIPLTNKAFSILEKIYQTGHDDNDYLITTKNGNHPSKRNMNRTLKAMLERSGCSNKACTLHGLRHSFASRAIRKGIQTEVLSKYLGHADSSITMNTYIHIIEEQKLQAIEILNL